MKMVNKKIYDVGRAVSRVKKTVVDWEDDGNLIGNYRS